MTDIHQICKVSGKPFVVTEADLAFYAKMGVPIPTLSPVERARRRLSHINHLNLYSRVCDATGEPIISCFPVESSLKVYSQKYWYSDQFDATQYGQDFDFSRPFFDQFRELQLKTPHPALITSFELDENSLYTNYAGMNKNCYLIFDSDQCRDCYYCYGMSKSLDSMDCFRVAGLELCYEAIDSNNCYNCAFISQSENCFDSMFLEDCIGCKNCLFSCNLKQKEYHVFNKPVSKEEFESIRNSLKSHKVLKQMQAEFERFRLQFPKKFMHGVQNENATGNHLVGCKDVVECYDCNNLRDGKYCSQTFMHGNKDYMDIDEVGVSELVYESTNVGLNGFFIRFTMNSLTNLSNLTYVSCCFNGCEHLFGCVGLKKKKHCILNKQYSEEEYLALVPRIIEHMKSTGEWGEYYPSQNSLFSYHLTAAQEYFPLEKGTALSMGLRWMDDPERSGTGAGVEEMPDHIDEVDDSILQKVFRCEKTGRDFKIIPQELAFYKRVGLPLPRVSFHQRHTDRMAKRTPRSLWSRNCMKCGVGIQTSFSPDRPEVVYCEACYLAEVY